MRIFFIWQSLCIFLLLLKFSLLPINSGALFIHCSFFYCKRVNISIWRMIFFFSCRYSFSFAGSFPVTRSAILNTKKLFSASALLNNHLFCHSIHDSFNNRNLADVYWGWMDMLTFSWMSCFESQSFYDLFVAWCIQHFFVDINCIWNTNKNRQKISFLHLNRVFVYIQYQKEIIFKSQDSEQIEFHAQTWKLLTIDRICFNLQK